MSKASISKEEFLRMLEDPAEPSRVIDVLEKTGLSSATVCSWQRKDRDFKKKYMHSKRIMANKGKNLEDMVQKKVPNGKYGWEDDFLNEYEKTGRFYHSADVAGVDKVTVLRRLDESDTMFDPVFSEKFKVSESRLDRTLQDVANGRAIEEGSDAMIKFLLTSRIPEKFGKTVTHNNIINAKVEYHLIEDKARQFLQSIFGEVIEGEVIGSTAKTPLALPASV